MRHYHFDSLARITKHRARKLWGKQDITLCPSNLRPGGPWYPECHVEADRIAKALASEYEHERQEASFDVFVRNFEWYNCVNRETGMYTAFYITETSENQ